jgi:hypothetical protein
VGMVAVEMVHLEICMLKGSVLDKLCRQTLQDMLKQVDMRAGSQSMELLMLMRGPVLALEKGHNTYLIQQHFFYPSCSSGRHKKTKHRSVLRKATKKNNQSLTIAETSKCIIRFTSPADLRIQHC